MAIPKAVIIYPICETEWNARSLLKSCCNNAIDTPITMVITPHINIKYPTGLFDANPKTINTNLIIAYTPVLLITPESIIEIDDGAAICASVGHVWHGTINALTAYPTIISENAIIIIGLIASILFIIAAISAKFNVFVSLYTKQVPSKINDEPKEPVTIYLKAASTDLSL